MSLFEKATRQKERFDSVKGRLSVEDLWDLPLVSRTGADLDSVAKNIAKNMRETGEESFVTKVDPKIGKLEFKLDIVKHIIAYRKDEIKARQEADERKERKERLGTVLEEKEMDELKSKSVKEIKKEMKSL